MKGSKLDVASVDMKTANLFLKIGACPCVLIGLLYFGITGDVFAERAWLSVGDAAVCTSYTLLSFVPFIIVFIYPGLPTTRKLVLFSAGVLEVLVLGLFVLSLLTLDD